ncbi:thioredoxin family protein [Cesiribacter andamanensis]|uniref:Thiol-disulfide oxidoreductase resA n=1 Tax=Cesiribacter andamanensis AMV16 TaxID=1279009 RepID=M7N6K1_9BACT|nr:thioredoxin family protein [Cesiribacter andamanensis]EMR02907.1 Thiol-disulfide oxidoreductase resA [Cesiribacter andamanensis AMV16]
MKHLLTLLMGALMLIGTAASPPAGYEVGDYVSDFTLRNVDGKDVSLSSYAKAKGAIVIFTCNTCPYSKLYEDRIIALHKQFEAKGYPVIAINPNDPGQQAGDSFEEMQKRAKDKGFTFPYLQDASGSVARAFGASRTPHVFILNKEAKGYKVEYIGAIDNNHKDAAAADQKYVEEAISQLMSGKKPKATTTKAIGCTIKWKEA